MRIETVEEPEKLVELLKNETSIILSTTYNELDSMVIDEIEELESNVSNRIMNLQLIEEVKVIKHNIFLDILNTNNEVIRKKIILKLNLKQKIKNQNI